MAADEFTTCRVWNVTMTKREIRKGDTIYIQYLLLSDQA
jgi:hypothetical protein